MKYNIEHRRTRAGKSRVAQGFTLVEILVVLAIIAILAGILFPVLRNAQENGRRIACASQMQQLGLAFQQYMQDSGGRLPGAGNYQDWGKGGHWVKGTDGANLAALDDNDGDGEYPYKAPNKANVEQGALFPYAKNAALYICPSNEDGEAKGITYGMNCALSGANSSRVRFPTSMVLLVDEWRSTDAYFWAVADQASTDTLTKDHNESGNLLFLDGHVRNYTNSGFPLDNNKTTPQSVINKSAGSTRANEPKTSDTPRFHDVTLGPNGSNYPTPFHGATDSCIQAVTTTPPPTTP
jgi:prepilin-type N-terminal cleavage/methylation domain-containing protein/prepilin-type processing-associated H-X9-DG protein